MSALSTTPYNQNFDALSYSGASATLPVDWYLFETGTNANANYSVGTGSGNAGDSYSFGASESSDRALGGLQSGSLVPAFGAKFENTTGSAITALDFSYTGEQWRIGFASRAIADRLDFQYSLDATSLSTGTWLDFNALDFIAPVLAGIVGALDGNAAANRTLINATLDGLSLENGATIWVRWNSFDVANADDGLAIDDFSVTVPAAGVGKMEITEYMYDGTNKEFIEFTNVGTAPVDMVGWSFDDDSRASGTVDLSAFGIVQPGQSVILSEATAAEFRAAWSLASTVKVIGGLTTNLGRADEINLFDAADVLVDRLTYGDQTYPGTVRTQTTSAWAPVDQLENQTIAADWILSAVNDVQNSRLSIGNDKGNPGNFNTGAPGVLVLETGGSTGATEGGATDAYSLVLRSAPNADVIIALDGNGQVVLGTPTLTFTPANWNVLQSVAISAIDDVLAEDLLNANITHTATSDDPAYGDLAVAPVAVTITDNDDASLPVVSLSVSSTSASEAAATSITVTATASAAVAITQTVSLGVSGSGITASDYLLSNSVITIQAGQTIGSVTFTITDDATAEADEIAQLTIANPSSSITLGETTRNVQIDNNDSSFLTKAGGALSANGAEIAAFDSVSDRVFVVAGPVVEIYAMNTDGVLATVTTLAPGFTPPAGTTAVPNSVAVKNGVVAVAWAVVNSTDGSQGIGCVTFHDSVSGSLIKDVSVGYLPDMLTFTADGRKVLVANEGEPNSYGQATSFDPVGSVSIVDLSNGIANATVQEAGFSSFNSHIDTLRAQGVRIFGPNATVAQDLEPEYISISPDGTTAFVTLQEANAFARVDIASATVTAIIPLGTKDFSAPGNGFDASDRDVNGTSAGGGKTIIQNWPVKGMYQPDAIASFTVDGQVYYITANEGDSRAWTGFDEEIRVGNSGYVLDPGTFLDAATLKQDANLGRMQLTRASGDIDGDGDFDQIMAFGARSFSVWDSAGNQVYDSGDSLEQITAARTPTLFNSDGASATFDSRSDNKGPEPEGLTIGVINGRTYGFLGIERSGDIMVFNLDNPTSPQFIQYINTPEDAGTEGLNFVAAVDSPTGKPLLITANEVSKTVAVFEISVPVRIADIQGASHISAMNGQGVVGVVGKVTAITSNGFWIQDPQPDNNDATSDAIFVFTTNASVLNARVVGEAIKVSGTVSEFRPGGDAGNLTTTEIVNGLQPLLVETWLDAPADAIIPLVLGVDRIPPSSIINDDFSGSGNVETGGDFNPAVEGIDFFESLEGMLVQVNNPLSVSPTNSFGEIWVLANNGSGATGQTARGGSLISENDFNPERIQLDNLSDQTFPTVNVGTLLNTVTGVVDYNFGNYEVRTLATPTVAQASTLQKEVTALSNSATQLTVSTFNVENLDPSDGASKFGALAAAIVNNLKAPDIINLEEVQDNNGATNNGTVDANITLQTLISAISAAGGPTYEYRQMNPANNQDGGEPGGNIRTAFLFNPARVGFVEGSLQRLTDTDLFDGDAFSSSRKPLVGTFTFNGEEITLVGNHFNSKGGDDALFGPVQPPELVTEVQRIAQARIVGDFVENLLDSDPGAYVIVGGDLNDFEFSAPLTELEDAGLTALIETLPANERYSYNFEGNAQTLDHLMASGGLMNTLNGYDVVHMNSEFADQVSDHDPVVARFNIAQGQTVAGSTTRNTLVGGAGNDTISGLGGRDQLTGGAGADDFVYTSLLDAGDLITDFQVGIDHLVIDALLNSVGHGAADPVSDGYLSVAAAAGRTYVQFDADGTAGSGAARLLVELVGVTSITADELLWD